MLHVGGSLSLRPFLQKPQGRHPLWLAALLAARASCLLRAWPRAGQRLGMVFLPHSFHPQGEGLRTAGGHTPGALGALRMGGPVRGAEAWI